MGDAYGNGQKAAELAGYAKGSAKVTASRLLKKAHIQEAIANLAAQIANQPNAKANQLIADLAERRQILTTHARSAENPHAAIKAVDVLNKMDGAYIERSEVTHVIPGSIAFIITQSPGAENRP